jgi:hypothetical protein
MKLSRGISGDNCGDSPGFSQLSNDGRQSSQWPYCPRVPPDIRVQGDAWRSGNNVFG